MGGHELHEDDWDEIVAAIVSRYDYGDLSLPFGGYMQSGIGRDKSLHALDNYTQLKTTYINVLDD